MKANHSCALAILFCTAIITTTQAAPPAWWAAQGVTTAQPADDFGAANVGQLKHIVKGAIAELNLRFPGQGGAGTTLTTLLASWTTPVPPTADDFGQLNSGQFKSICTPLYDRFVALNLVPAVVAAPHPYPWTGTTMDDDDFSLVTVGQIKRAFDFDFLNTDRDADGLNDFLELAYMKTSPSSADSDGDTIPDGFEDADGDGILNLDEALLGLNPEVSDAQQGAAQKIFTYDRLGRVRSEKDRTAPLSTIVVDPQGNLNSIQP